MTDTALPTPAQPGPASWPELTTGHGTGNDFVLFTDADARLDLSAHRVAALADRHTGLGADGVIRAVRSAALPEGAGLDAEWFMDYRNADGSIAQMCGNGARVFVRYLVDQGLIDLPDGGEVAIGTRAGALRVRREGDLLAVAMGTYGIPGGEAAEKAGWDAEVSAAGLGAPRPGLSITMPNPHVVIAVATEAELADADLSRAPSVLPNPPEGTNVEIVHAVGEYESAGVPVGVLAMRVHERGVGETLSCGTGACAAALAARVWGGAEAPAVWDVRVPGGQLQVRFGADHQVELVGPAVLTARAQWLAPLT